MSMPWPDPVVISTSSRVDASCRGGGSACRRRTRASRGSPAAPAPGCTSPACEPSRRSTEAVASIRPSIGISTGSLWPPTKLYFGKSAEARRGIRQSLGKARSEIECGAHDRFPLPSGGAKTSHGGSSTCARARTDTGSPTQSKDPARMATPKLFEPNTFRSVAAHNRIVAAPICLCRSHNGKS